MGGVVANPAFCVWIGSFLVDDPEKHTYMSVLLKSLVWSSKNMNIRFTSIVISSVALRRAIRSLRHFR